MDLAPGEGLPVWSNLQRGMCILNSFPISAGQVTEFQRIEDNYREAQNTRTFADAQRRKKSDPQMAADTYEALKKHVTTYGMYLLTLFGKNVNTTKGFGQSTGSWLFMKTTHHTSQSSTARRSLGQSLLTVVIYSINA